MSKKKKGTSLFHQGKERKDDICHTSFNGPSNTNLDTYRKGDGRLHQRRKYGADGYAVKDYDMPDYSKKYEHVHDISRETGRGEKRPPNKKEQREINKAKRKRRFWKDD